MRKKYLLLVFPCEGFQKGFYWAPLVIDEIWKSKVLHNAPCQGFFILCIHTKYHFFLMTEVKVLLRRMNCAIFLYFLFHASVKNTLSSATDSLGNVEMCPCDDISHGIEYSKTQLLSKVLIWRGRRQSLRSTLFQKWFWYHLR